MIIRQTDYPTYGEYLDAYLDERFPPLEYTWTGTAPDVSIGRMTDEIDTAQLWRKPLKVYSQIVTALIRRHQVPASERTAVRQTLVAHRGRCQHAD